MKLRYEMHNKASSELIIGCNQFRRLVVGFCPKIHYEWLAKGPNTTVNANFLALFTYIHTSKKLLQEKTITICLEIATSGDLNLTTWLDKTIKSMYTDFSSNKLLQGIHLSNLQFSTKKNPQHLLFPLVAASFSFLLFAPVSFSSSPLLV